MAHEKAKNLISIIFLLQSKYLWLFLNCSFFTEFVKTKSHKILYNYVMIILIKTSSNQTQALSSQYNGYKINSIPLDGIIEIENKKDKKKSYFFTFKENLKHNIIASYTNNMAIWSIKDAIDNYTCFLYYMDNYFTELERAEYQLAKRFLDKHNFSLKNAFEKDINFMKKSENYNTSIMDIVSEIFNRLYSVKLKNILLFYTRYYSGAINQEYVHFFFPFVTGVNYYYNHKSKMKNADNFLQKNYLHVENIEKIITDKGYSERDSIRQEMRKIWDNYAREILRVDISREKDIETKINNVIEININHIERHEITKANEIYETILNNLVYATMVYIMPSDKIYLDNSAQAYISVELGSKIIDISTSSYEIMPFISKQPFVTIETGLPQFTKFLKNNQIDYIDKSALENVQVNFLDTLMAKSYFSNIALATNSFFNHNLFVEIGKNICTNIYENNLNNIETIVKNDIMPATQDIFPYLAYTLNNTAFYLIMLSRELDSAYLMIFNT